MREDLIERLQLKRDVWRGTEFGDDICELLDEAADALEAAREDAARYRWLRMMAKEQLLDPRAAGSEWLDMRTYWRLPTLICSGPVGGFMSFDAAVDQARGKGVAGG